jgi:hypothetical protein
VAVGAAAIILGWRWATHRWLLPTGGDDRAFLLLCPNLTIVALASSTLLNDGGAPQAAAWMLLTGLFNSFPAILWLPRPPGGAGEH